MNTIYTSILFFTLILNSHAQQWNVLNEGFTGREIDFVNENLGWIVGDGKILKTEDGGVTWDSYSTDENWSFRNVDFIDESTGWACVDTTIIYSNTDTHPATTIHKTEDGGQNWFIQAPGQGFPLGDKVLHAVNYSVIYLSSYEYLGGPNNDNRMSLLKTLDGGETWNDISPYRKNRRIFTIRFLDSDHGICIGSLLDPVFTEPYISFTLRTNDGGRTWQEQRIPGFSAIYDFNLVSDSTGYFVGWLSANDDRDEAYYICMTDDFLNTWSVVYQVPSGNIDEINSFYCLDNSNLFATVMDTNWSRYFIRSNDGGSTWQETQNNGWLSNQGKIYFLNENDGMILSSRLLLETNDGGNSWIYRYFSYDLYGIQLLNANEGFIYGGGEGFHHSTWGYLSNITEGRNFQIIYNAGFIKKAYFVDDLTGFVISPLNLREYNLLSKTDDGGRSWREFGFIDDDSVRFRGNDLYFLNDNKGWIVGSGIYETTDNGEHWDVVYTLTDTADNRLSLNSVHGCDTSVWAVGEQGLMVKYSPHNPWQQQPFVTDLPLNDVFFSHADHGWVAGGYLNDQGFQSIILKTTNGGQNWNAFHPDKYLINDMFFTDSLHGWLVGSDTASLGVILETFNGGENWIPIIEDLSVPLNAIDYKDGIGWAVGGKGLILKTDDGSTWIGQSTGKTYPDHFSLSQNYPNPFNPVTNIEYTVRAQRAVPQHINLSIYNILGQKVATLVNKKQPAGSYQVQWDASGFASGVYFYQLETDRGFVQTKKLMLMK